MSNISHLNMAPNGAAQSAKEINNIMVHLQKSESDSGQNSSVNNVTIRSNNGDVERVVSTVLDEGSIQALCRIFGNEKDYREHMKTLWSLREVAGKACEYKTPQGWTLDQSSPMFRIWKLCNDVIGAVIQNNFEFSSNNGLLKFRKEDINM